MSYITQIFISDNDEQELSEILSYSTGTIKKLYPECEYTLYNNSMLRNFISEHFDKEVLWTYDSLIPYAAKSDLGRFCVSYIKGGWYSDITIKHISRLENYTDYDFICFYDAGAGFFLPNAYKFSVQNSFFYTKPKNIILKECINSIIENCKLKHYGDSSVCPTGPGVFGLNYAKYGHLTDLSLRLEGIFTPLTPNHHNKNRSYILPDGWIVAQHKCAWHSKNIYDFGVNGTNNYFDLWYQRKFYV